MTRRSRLRAAIFIVASCSIGGGCATLHPVHASPTPSEIAEINAPGSPIVVEPLPMRPWGRQTWTIDHIVFADAEKIVVAPDDGPPFAFRVGEVASFHVRRTGHGFAVGGAIGAAIGAFGGLAAALIISRMGDGPGPGPPDRSPSSGPSAGTVVEASLALAAIGALFYGSIGGVIGAIAGAPEDFPAVWTAPPFPVGPATFVPTYDAPAPPVSRPPPPASRSAAIVVAATAEVRSAPFAVAPVVVVLARGARLFVGETPRAGWRVAYLPDGRVGYVEDARIKTGSP